ncbi:hypothetical protein [Dactylosporangium cerinum]
MNRPALHWPSIRGRARADAGPLLLAAAVVAAVAFLAGAVPPLLRTTADDAVRDTVRRAGGDADVLVHSRFERDDGPSGGRLRAPLLADDVDDFRDRASFELGAGLHAVLQPPVAVVTSPVLNVTDGSVLRTFQLAYLAADGGGPAVTWIAGTAPGPAAAAGTDRFVVAPYVGPPWPVQVGLSEADAAALGLSPGDTIALKDEHKQVKDVRVSGIFRPADDADPAWRLAPSVLHPVAGADGVGTTRLGGLLSRDSLPDARLAFDQDQLQRTVRFAPDRTPSPGPARPRSPRPSCSSRPPPAPPAAPTRRCAGSRSSTRCCATPEPRSTPPPLRHPCCSPVSFRPRYWCCSSPPICWCAATSRPSPPPGTAGRPCPTSARSCSSSQPRRHWSPPRSVSPSPVPSPPASPC